MSKRGRPRVCPQAKEKMLAQGQKRNRIRVEKLEKKRVCRNAGRAVESASPKVKDAEGWRLRTQTKGGPQRTPTIEGDLREEAAKLGGQNTRGPNFLG